MIYNIIKQLEQTSARKEKEQILLDNFYNEELKAFLKMALDPTQVFYIKEIPEYISCEDLPWKLSWAMDELNKFSSRQLTGHDAIFHLKYILSSLDKEDAELIKRIIGKNPKCGVGASTVNKIWKGLVPEFPYMRMSLLKDMKNVDWEYGMISQTKEDASFVNVIIQDGEVTLLTRNGNQYDNTLFPEQLFQELVSTGNNSVLHGELIVYKDDTPLPRKDSNGMMNSIQSGEPFPENHYPVIVLWDMISIKSFIPKGEYKAPYDTRLFRLEQRISVSKYIKLVESRWVYSLEEAMKHYKENLTKGLEGTILKKPKSIWKDGTSKDCYKLKIKADVDLLVIGYNQGTGRNSSTFGSLKCVSACGELEVDVNGRGDDMRSLGAKYYMGKIITVSSNGIQRIDGKKASLFLPIFEEVRLDKDTANTLEEIQEIFDNLVK